MLKPESITSGNSGFVTLAERGARHLDRIIFGCLLALIVIVVIPYGSVDAWWEAVFECAIFALTALWILESLLRDDWQVRKLFIVLPAILITVYAFVQAVEWGSQVGVPRMLTIDHYQTYLTARKALALTLFLGLLLVHTSTEKRLHWLVRLIIALGFASALFGLLRQFLQAPDSTIGFGLPFLYYGFGYGEFISANVFAYLMEMVFALIAGLILGGGIARSRIAIYIAAAVIVWTALVLSNSRGGILGFSCQAIFLGLVSLTRYSARRLSRDDEKGLAWLSVIHSSKLVRILAVALMVGALIAGVLWIGGDQLALKAQRENAGRDIDGSTRKEIWQATWRLIKQHPWTGVGFGAYFLAIPEYQVGSGRLKVEQAHNDYLDLAANGGLIALALASWFIGLIFWRGGLMLRSADSYRRAASLGAMAGILGIGVHSVVDFGLQVTGIALVFLALVVVLFADTRANSIALGASRDLRTRRRSPND